VSTFKKAKKSHLKRTLFFDEPVDIARYDQVKHPWLDKLTEKQEGFFWRPSEIVLTRDNRDFKALLPHEQHIFTSNLKRQIMLDSIQGRAPSLAFLPIASLPELEAFITIWTDFERIHNKSYTHILRNVYPNPSIVFDKMLEIKEIVDCAADISKYYDDLITYNSLIRGLDFKVDTEHKKALWMCLNAVNALEGIRFYVSFACSWAFAEVKKMEGNAKIIKFIARDENVHLAATQQLLKVLPKDDPDFTQIRDTCSDEVRGLFLQVVEQEKQWARYLFKDGSIIGLNEELLILYVEWIARKRMGAIGIDSPFTGPGSNPLPWTAKWIAGSDVQVAPQEVEISSYIVGGVKQDITDDTLKGLSL
jgi:ribonucleoside-diphosphate reductase beta chain